MSDNESSAEISSKPHERAPSERTFVDGTGEPLHVAGERGLANSARRAVKGGLGLLYWEAVYGLVTRNRPLAADYRHIYFYHVRKTGGTSLHHAFLSLVTNDSDELIDRLNGRQLGTARSGRFVFSHGPEIIERGLYSYGYGHAPRWQVALHPSTFTLAVLRDPAERLISYFKHKAQPTQATVGTIRPGDLVRATPAHFDRFLASQPPHLISNQLHMFSETSDVPEAVDSALHCSAILFTEAMSDGVKKLNETLGLELRPLHMRQATAEVEITTEQRERLRDLLADEYSFIEQVRSALAGSIRARPVFKWEPVSPSQ